MMKNFIISSLLITALGLSIGKAFAQDPGDDDQDGYAKGAVIETNCCRNGTKVGNSNDCVSSSTSDCENGKCNSGATEEFGTCPS